MTELSVVVPVYGCESCLQTLHQRLSATLRGMGVTYELILIDDRSIDGGWDVLREIASSDKSARAFRLSRNFGQHAAITAGLAQARGRWTVVMDCDLQDPPEEIARIYAKAQEGYDLVLAERRVRKQAPLRRFLAHAYFRLANIFLKTNMHTNYANLSIISTKVRDACLSLRDKDRQYLLMLHWLGFEKATIEIEPAERYQGKSSYSFMQLLRVATDGLFFQSTVLLRWIVYAGFLLAAAGVLLAVYAMALYLGGRGLPQWTALPVLILVLAGFIIVSTGVSGLYIGKIFDQVKGRPLYVIDTKVEAGVEAHMSEEAPLQVQADSTAWKVGAERAGRP